MFKVTEREVYSALKPVWKLESEVLRDLEIRLEVEGNNCEKFLFYYHLYSLNAKGYIRCRIREDFEPITLPLFGGKVYPREFRQVLDGERDHVKSPRNPLMSCELVTP